jgi:HupE / UreJ protein
VKLVCLVACFLSMAAALALAHETRPAYLELQELDAGRYRVLWKRPILGEVALPLELRLPESCRDLEPPTRYATLGSLTERRIVTCGDGGLAGKAVAIDGLEASITDALVRIQGVDGRTQTRLLKPAAPSFIAPASRSAGGVAVEYIILGIDHILRGIDHLLFVLGLLLIVGSRWMLFKTITSFTIAHSLTLGAATFGLVSVPVTPLNAVIALSILFLAPEMVRAWRGETSLTIRRPWLVAFAFGLLHGFGFASGLTDLGLPPEEIPVALLLFNIGVELGQVGFVGLILALAGSFRILEIKWPRGTDLVPAYAVGCFGAFWTVERTAVLLGVIR